MISRERVKVCKRCRKPKRLRQFWKNRASKDGRHATCALCQKKAAASTRDPNRPLVCSICFGLPHRVAGKRCKGCRMTRMSEPPPRLENTLRSSAGTLLDHGDS